MIVYVLFVRLFLWHAVNTTFGLFLSGLRAPKDVSPYAYTLVLLNMKATIANKNIFALSLFFISSFSLVAKKSLRQTYCSSSLIALKMVLVFTETFAKCRLLSLLGHYTRKLS